MKNLNSAWIISLKFIFYFLFTFILSSCSSHQKATGISEEEINQEAALAYQQIKSQSKISNHKKWNEMVQRVAQRISESSNEKFDWEYVLIESDEVNAWCMPGGKIAVYTGILPVVKTEAALAAVLGHEVAHATLRHGMQRYARAKQNNYWGLIVAGATLIGGEVLCKTDTCRKMTQLGGYAAGFAITFLDRQFSREDEIKADQTGQIMMAKAGYDPTESLKLWDRMSAAKHGMAPPEFLSTHPSDKTRKQKLNSWLPQAQIEYSLAEKKYGLGELIQ